MHKLYLAIFTLFSLSGPKVLTPITMDLTGEVDSQMVETVKETLAKTDGPVTIRITSPGGSLFAAIQIENAIEDHGNVTCIARGYAASAAASILESCQIRKATSDSIVMLHQVALTNTGDSSVRERDAENTKNTLKALDYALCVQLTKRALITHDQMCKMIADGKEVWLTAPQALKLGLIDQIIP